MPNLTEKTKMAVAKYGHKVCVYAYQLHEKGNGASTIGFMFKLTTNQADAAINAGRELSND